MITFSNEGVENADWLRADSKAKQATEQEIKSFETFNSRLSGLVKGVYNGNIGGDFIDSLAALLQREITLAYRHAWEDEGVENKPVPEALVEEANKLILQQFDYVDQYYKDIVNAKIDKKPLGPLLQRVELWAARYDQAYNAALLKISELQGGKLKWVMGATREHCETCLALDNNVAFASEWIASGIRPQHAPNDVLECGGWKCKCSLQPTEERRTYGIASKLQDISTRTLLMKHAPKGHVFYGNQHIKFNFGGNSSVLNLTGGKATSFRNITVQNSQTQLAANKQKFMMDKRLADEVFYAGHPNPLRSEVAAEITRNMGYDATQMAARTIEHWNIASNSGYGLNAVAQQESVARVFGQKLSRWQRKEFAAQRSAKSTFAEGVKSEAPLRDDINRAIYAKTQQFFADKGFKPEDEVVLYRALTVPDVHSMGVHLGSKIAYNGNCIESWTADFFVARSFNTKKDHVALGMRVPIRNIFSISRTGLGTSSESEVVIFGNQKNQTAQILEFGRN